VRVLDSDGRDIRFVSALDPAGVVAHGWLSFPRLSGHRRAGAQDLRKGRHRPDAARLRPELGSARSDTRDRRTRPRSRGDFRSTAELHDHLVDGFGRRIGLCVAVLVISVPALILAVVTVLRRHTEVVPLPGSYS
jgi:hypothetical protein